MAPILSTFGSAASRNYGLSLLSDTATVQILSFKASASWTAPTDVTSIDYLVVAGGGGGGASIGGGGGAGGSRVGRSIC